ncbi:unnamed protein product [Arabis nemorensis]|uniref:Uncharacterized protein n=1 Tax=Arabis nemorensis TaxID=586526 RepID=A0A565CWE7_9BRAS|nr:unnamed protein product [Arabis nemorensis]
MLLLFTCGLSHLNTAATYINVAMMEGDESDETRDEPDYDGDGDDYREKDDKRESRDDESGKSRDDELGESRDDESREDFDDIREEGQTKGNTKRNEVWWDYECAGVPKVLDRYLSTLPYEKTAYEVYDRFVRKLKDKGFTGETRIRIVVGYSGTPVKPYLKNNNQCFDYYHATDEKRLEQKEERYHDDNIMIVTGDGDFGDILRDLRNEGITTMVAYRRDPNVTSQHDVTKCVEYSWEWLEFLELAYCTKFVQA